MTRTVRHSGLIALLLLAACDDSVAGVRDCDVLAKNVNDSATATACATCQGVSCESTDCTKYPCVDGVRVIQGCDDDGDCATFEGTLCGQHSAPDHICSSSADDQ